MRRSQAFLAMLVLSLAVAGVGCPCLRGPINGSEGVRWWLFSTFAASRICPETLKRGVPLKVGALGANSLGRFFPRQCQVTVNNEARTIALQLGGDGYAHLPVARRLGFAFTTVVEFRPDFRLEDEGVYVWGQFSRLLVAPELHILGVENRIVDLATQTPLGNVANVVGQGIITSEIARGFTVIRSDDGDDFALGIVRAPSKIKRPFASSDRHILGTDTTEIHPQGREYLGPFEVDDPKHKLFLRLRVTGAPVTLAIVDRITGDAWIQGYERALPLGPPPGIPLASGTVPVGESTRSATLPRGMYYVVLDNLTGVAVLPLGIPLPLGETVSNVSYAVELGEE